jgi:hypothetical protein
MNVGFYATSSNRIRVTIENMYPSLKILIGDESTDPSSDYDVLIKDFNKPEEALEWVCRIVNKALKEYKEWKKRGEKITEIVPPSFKVDLETKKIELCGKGRDNGKGELKRLHSFLFRSEGKIKQ